MICIMAVKALVPRIARSSKAMVISLWYERAFISKMKNYIYLPHLRQEKLLERKPHLYFCTIIQWVDYPNGSYCFTNYVSNKTFWIITRALHCDKNGSLLVKSNALSFIHTTSGYDEARDVVTSIILRSFRDDLQNTCTFGIHQNYSYR